MTRSTPRRTLTGVARWLRTERIGVGHGRLARRYLGFALLFGLWGGLDALLLRTALVTPGLDRWGAETYAAFFTTHGLTMLFLFALPAIWGVAYAAVPSLIGADRTAFPALATAAFWSQVLAALAIRAGTIGGVLGVGGLEPVAVGWTLYTPLSALSANPAIDALLVGLLLVAVGTALTGVDLVVTIVRRRRVPWRDVDTFTWTVLTAAAMAAVAFPVLALAASLLLADRALGTGFVAAGGGPQRWQHLFWFFAHPLVYILVLPPMGIVSHVLPRFAGRRLFGRHSAVYSTVAIGVISFVVWGHHLFVASTGPSTRMAFMVLTLAVAVPSSAKLCSWLGTLWGGSIRYPAPMLAVVAAVGFFVVGGVTGVFLAVSPINVQYNGTYYVVAHFHLLLAGFVALALVAGVYYWFPLLTGRQYDPDLARLHVRLTIVGIAVAFGSLLLVGLAGQPRRVATYASAYAPLHQLATVGAYVIAVGQLVFLANLARSLRRGDPAPDDPWDLADAPAHAREWNRR
ncbi:cytochrome c oxidase subunit I [Halobiforma nitratireducens]|uniref:Cytochrome C oxidase subunit I n=1 Tax=Halobiforma nitratireducens JCM 10879 TaxID=1227454 RepID=M0LTF2_9EURY|nr:cbb3-type cytochrome c oxidase subunit I [Halobiforma nitratireducens]EMA36837.1 cytochrome C oxidase subunit I [Halobiforma nitratireducens JCM 10879]